MVATAATTKTTRQMALPQLIARYQAARAARDWTLDAADRARRIADRAKGKWHDPRHEVLKASAEILMAEHCLADSQFIDAERALLNAVYACAGRLPAVVRLGGTMCVVQRNHWVDVYDDKASDYLIPAIVEEAAVIDLGDGA
jgi:hypothetical protein